eukprot:CAMPEP_0196762550 /NCGR_PEP_ID=MMETSP1095-20130614/2260_1 /TAXON_ID=96789 ORGANISM="Chromulina nebulosa, Strain UTEXLB2642" /NCGR_SAMPLE_ID=MMETSP1095 /ASSEMBLY_ACC=CAM_ASM_000446 /LENGTH=105 /DNA_ID=CAMNT_0042113785 /DNA_START=33 /DNA_END=347 /DNA_ORIENTATION=-
MANRNRAEKPVDYNKKLKIQVSVCKRLLKEVEAYEKEVIYNENRVQKMRDDNKDEYDIRKQEEVLQESYMMIPDSKRRLEAAIEELQSVLDDVQNIPDIDKQIIN